MNAKPNDNEIVTALRDESVAVYNGGRLFSREAVLALADLIETLQAQLAASQRRAQDARNELCQKCGRYREAHNGACDGCRWREI